MSQRVESSLRALFRELSGGVEGDIGGKSEGSGAGGTRTTSASVDALRMALADVSGARFEAGKMDDAAEAMETILGEMSHLRSVRLSSGGKSGGEYSKNLILTRRKEYFAAALLFCSHSKYFTSFWHISPECLTFLYFYLNGV